MKLDQKTIIASILVGAIVLLIVNRQIITARLGLDELF